MIGSEEGGCCQRCWRQVLAVPRLATRARPTAGAMAGAEMRAAEGAGGSLGGHRGWLALLILVRSRVRRTRPPPLPPWQDARLLGGHVVAHI